METIELKVRYHNTNVEALKTISVGDAIDVRCAEEVYLNFGEYREIPLGFSMEIPEGYYALVIPRSSTFKKYRILQTNSVGLIDSAYCGDGDVWKMPVLCMSTTGSLIEEGERIAQFLVVKKQPVTLKTVDRLEGPNRGGFGSTGRK